jgi:hypothetical protein
MLIWLGTVKLRMLRLVGRKADGWLPSLRYLKPGELVAGQAISDEAAAGAGRDPREIRRLANITGRFSRSSDGFLVGPSEQWVELLLPLVLEDGVATPEAKEAATERHLAPTAWVSRHAAAGAVLMQLQGCGTLPPVNAKIENNSADKSY